MLKGIDPVLSADLLWVLDAMGHGDVLALVDANHPAEKIARATTSGRLVRLPGLTMERVATAILSVLPIDDFESDPVLRMQVVGKPKEVPAVQKQVQAVITATVPGAPKFASIERFAFYEQASRAFAVVQVGDPRPYGCFLLRKGIIPG